MFFSSFYQKIFCHLKTAKLPPTCPPFLWLNQTSNQIRPFIYVTVLRAEPFKFSCGVIFGNLCSNWCLLIVQTGFQDFLVENFFGFWFDNVCLTSGHTEEENLILGIMTESLKDTQSWTKFSFCSKNQEPNQYTVRVGLLKQTTAKNYLI